MGLPVFGPIMSFGNLLELWATLGFLVILDQASDYGPSEERVKWSFTLSNGQLDYDTSYGL